MDRLKPGSPEWEAVCERCGRCCCEKIEYEGVVYYTDRLCPHLDPETRQCRVYPDRRKVQPDCVALDQSHLDLGILPHDCPYVAGRSNARKPLPWPED
ncbi:MAG: hypothetical protein D6751_04760 [Deltaproteobacteria bacterium]|nr:MAG: hypothetical protein D6751_04760 [Deltaproteobacteria bacterium]